MNRSVSMIALACVALLLIAGAVFYFGKDEQVYVQDASVASVSKQDAIPEILFVGDIMLDRGVALHAKKYGVETLFQGVKDLLASSDVVIGNLEGSITNFESKSQKDTSLLQFTFDPSYARLLRSHNVALVSLANNHAFDYGSEGYAQTFEHLTKVGILPFGSPRNDKSTLALLRLKDKDFCFFGYHDLFSSDQTGTVARITDTTDCSYKIVFAHWGEEYKVQENDRQKKLAHEFIDAGADLVIGAHPHVVQPIEIYKGKAIFYSLGNFIFDQNFSFETTHGLAVRVSFLEDKTEFELIPIFIDRDEVKIANDAAPTRVVQLLTTVEANEESTITAIEDSIRTKKSFLLSNQ